MDSSGIRRPAPNAVDRHGPSASSFQALGAACLAGLAIGFWKTEDDLRSNWALDRRFEPMMDGAERAKRRRRWGKAIDHVRGWASDD